MEVRLVAQGFIAVLDETWTGHDPAVDFLVYGGTLIPADRIASVDAAISTAQRTAGFPAASPLKWSSRSKPAGVTTAAHASAKNSLIRALGAEGCLLFTSVVHVGVALGAGPGDVELQWGANGVLRAIHRHLEDVDGHAFVCLDTMPTSKYRQFIEEKGEYGLVRSRDAAGGPKTFERLSQMVGFAVTTATASRLASAVDVPLGGLAYCMRPPVTTARASVAGVVLPLLARDRAGGCSNRGVSFYPNSPIKGAAYRACYRGVRNNLTSLGVPGLPTIL